MKHRIINMIPLFILSLIVIFTWIQILTTESAATWKHYSALSLLIINGVVYSFNHKLAVLLTGIILILATFNLLAFFTIIDTSFIRVGKIETPEIQLKALLVLVIYLVINFNFLINWLLNAKEERAAKKMICKKRKKTIKVHLSGFAICGSADNFL